MIDLDLMPASIALSSAKTERVKYRVNESISIADSTILN